MPAFKTGKVETILQERAGLQRVEVNLDGALERAYVLTQLTGPVGLGDHVIVNTTAVDLGLGTGGWHVVHWNLAHDHYSAPGPGHIMKARYTSLQTDVGSSEEHWTDLADISSIEGMPVVAAALHSQVPAIAAAFKHVRPDLRLAYVMTDGAALPLALSDLVAQLRDRELLDAAITCGHAFGGDYEAVSTYSALAIARHIVHADATIVAMGPGDRGHRDPARVQRHRSRSGARRRDRARRSPHRVPPRVVRRPAGATPRGVAPQRDRTDHRHARTSARARAVRGRRARRRHSRRPPRDRARRPTRDRRRATDRRHRLSSSRSTCTWCRWAGRRRTIP